jgi:hypothetical protein
MAINVTGRDPPNTIRGLICSNAATTKTIKHTKIMVGAGSASVTGGGFGENGKSGFGCLLADMSTKPSPEHELDRWPNNETGNYEPGNCRWATAEEQANNRRNNVIVAFDSDALSETLSLAQWDRKLEWWKGKLRKQLTKISHLRDRLNGDIPPSGELPAPLARACEHLMDDLENSAQHESMLPEELQDWSQFERNKA